MAATREGKEALLEEHEVEDVGASEDYAVEMKTYTINNDNDDDGYVKPTPPNAIYGNAYTSAPSMFTTWKRFGYAWFLVLILLIIVTVLALVDVRLLHMRPPGSWFVRLGWSFEWLNTTADVCTATQNYVCGMFTATQYNVTISNMLAYSAMQRAEPTLMQLATSFVPSNLSAWTNDTITCMGLFADGVTVNVAPDQEDPLQHYAIYISRAGCVHQNYVKLPSLSVLSEYPMEVSQVVDMTQRTSAISSCLPSIPSNVSLYYNTGCTSTSMTAMDVATHAYESRYSVNTLALFWSHAINTQYNVYQTLPTAAYYTQLLSLAESYMTKQQWSDTLVSFVRSINVMTTFNTQNQDCTPAPYTQQVTYESCRNTWFAQQLALLTMIPTPNLQIPVVAAQTSMVYVPGYHTIYVPAASVSMPYYYEDLEPDWNLAGAGFFFLQAVGTALEAYHANNSSCGLDYPTLFAINVLEPYITSEYGWNMVLQWGCQTPATTATTLAEVVQAFPSFQKVHNCPKVSNGCFL